MLSYLSRRILQAIPVLILVSIAIFSILYLLPGDPAALMLAETGASAEAVARLRTQLGLDQPAYIQYFRFVGNALRGDFGYSLYSGRPVIAEIRSYLPNTLQLALAAALIAILIGVVSGIIAALYQNSWVDTLMMLVSLFGVSMPIFWLGLMMIFIFSVQLRWFPTTGQGGLNRLVLPAVALGFAYSGTIARLTRSSMLEVLRQEYMTTARAKGLSEFLILIRHGLRNALIPVVTMVGLQLGQLFGGTVIVETVFARPGLGSLTVNSIFVKDFRVVQATILMSAVIYMGMNLLVDFLYTLLDPRIKATIAEGGEA
jgi:ABC-type dipeptide/oligopeptide/nickel transport system permease component